MCCLGNLAWADEDFSFRLHSNNLFRRVFEAKFVPNLASAVGDDPTTNNGPSVDETSDSSDSLNEAERAAMEFIEHGLLNRTNFACGQKSLLCHCYQNTMENVYYRKLLVDLANEELEYVSLLLRPLNSEIVERAKRSVSMWLEREVSEVEEDDKTEETYNSDSQSDDETEEDDNEVHAVTDEE